MNVSSSLEASEGSVCGEKQITQVAGGMDDRLTTSWALTGIVSIRLTLTLVTDEPLSQGKVK